ncbi:hypothetical protein PRIPAC_83299, partial [Pristionchus pacificus]|uniref:Lipase n=1 Tax=Pristionchus pacificus TaxID=54126 RepID=A0A2A6BP24_PRIPA
NDPNGLNKYADFCGPFPSHNMLQVVCVCFILLIFNSAKALDDPESFMTPIEIIRYWGYPAENYDVITKDGYILALQRIPHGRNSEANSSCTRPAVLLVHGQGTDGTQYIMNPPESSPAFILADAGFDVFLLNQRGTTYSKRHVTLKPHFGSKFWQYSVDEMSKYDATATIDKVLKITGQKAVYWIGHSQGTLVGFMTLSGQPKYNSKFYRFAIGSHEVLSLWPSTYRPLAHLCNSIPWLAQEICFENFELLFGPPAKTFNWDKSVNQYLQTRLPVYLSHFPAGTSTQSVLHLAQIVTHAKVEYMDHNPLENMQRYGQLTPPPYNYSNMDVPVYLYWSRDDWLTNPEGIQHYIVPNIRKHLLKGGLEVPGYNHLDFSLATDCAEKVWLPIANVMRSMESGETCGR